MNKQPSITTRFIKVIFLSFLVVSLSACGLLYQEKEIESYTVGPNELIGRNYEFDRLEIRRFLTVEEVYFVSNEEELALLIMKNFERNIFSTNYHSHEVLSLQRVHLYLETVLYDSFYLQAGIVVHSSKEDQSNPTRFIDVIIDEKQKDVNDTYASNIIQSLNIQNKPIRSQLKTIHEYIVLNTRYDETLLELDINSYESHPSFTPYGVYEHQTAVCSGYARALMQLTTKVDIPTVMVSSQNMNHAWNMMYIEGQWLFVDATWNDPLPDQEGRVMTTYYLLTLDQMKQQGHHFFDLPSDKTLGIEEVVAFAEFAFGIDQE